MMIALLALFVLMFLTLEGFFSGSETAIISASRARLQAIAARGNPRAKLAVRLLAAPSRLLATTLVGTNFSVVTATSLAALLVERTGIVSKEWESTVTTLLMLPVILVFGELLPKSIGRGNAQAYTLAIAPALARAQRIMAPVVTLVSGLSTGMLRLVGVKNQARNPFVNREEIEALADISAETGVLTPLERRMIHRVFDLNRTTLGSIMVPLVNLRAFPVGATLETVMYAAERSTFSRVPVYEDRADNIVGLVSIVQVVNAIAAAPGDAGALPLAPLVDRTVPFMPESKPVGRMLRELQRGQRPVVFVVDEYGGVVGMVTAQDLAETIVGELAIERSEDRPVIVERREGIECEGRVDVDVIGDRLGVTFDRAGYDTIAGLVLKLAGNIPPPGTLVEYHGLYITVTDADSKRVKRLRISTSAPTPTHHAAGSGTAPETTSE